MPCRSSGMVAWRGWGHDTVRGSAGIKKKGPSFKQAPVLAQLLLRDELRSMTAHRRSTQLSTSGRESCGGPRPAGARSFAFGFSPPPSTRLPTRLSPCIVVIGGRIVKIPEPDGREHPLMAGSSPRRAAASGRDRCVQPASTRANFDAPEGQSQQLRQATDPSGGASDAKTLSRLARQSN